MNCFNTNASRNRSGGFNPRFPPSASRPAQQGLTLIELIIAVTIATFLMLGLTNVVGRALDAWNASRASNDLARQAQFAMQQMTTSVKRTSRLMLPLNENPLTAWSESVRDVLAVTLDPTLDRDNDGWADANNDKDYLDLNNNGSRDAGEPERIDEDVGRDNTNDNAKGIYLIDDNGDGIIDNTGASEDNDEDGVVNEDSLNGLDDDGDQSIDEDIHEDMGNDGVPGKKDIDDDFDGAIDEGQPPDDDEDGLKNEDWLDPVVFYLNGTTLYQRMPNLNPLSGRDYTVYTIAENVTLLRVERLPQSANRAVLVDITLELTGADGDTVSLNTRARVGSGL